MANLEEKMLEGFEKKPMIWWRYIDDIFFIWEHGEESLKVFTEQVNMLHSKIKFTTEYSKEEVEEMGNLIQICLLNLRTRISFWIQLLAIPTTARKEYLTLKL